MLNKTLHTPTLHTLHLFTFCPSLCPFYHPPGVISSTHWALFPPRCTLSSSPQLLLSPSPSSSYPRFLSAVLLYLERGPWVSAASCLTKDPSVSPPPVFPPLPPHPLPQHPCGTFPPSPLVHSLLTSAGWGVPLSAGLWNWNWASTDL